MSRSTTGHLVLTPPEQRVEEIRAIRRRLFGRRVSAKRLRELGSSVPAGFRVLDGIRPIQPLSAQLSRGRTARVVVR